MQNIDINKLKEIKEELELLDRDDVLFVDDEDETKFAILPIEKYDEFEELVNLLNDKQANGTAVKIVTSDDKSLTYEEYEKIRKQMIEVFDKAFKPKPEKLN